MAAYLDPEVHIEHMKSGGPFSRFDHIQIAIPAGSETIARQFYAEALGFEEIAKPPELARRGGAWFRSGDVLLNLGVAEPFSAATKAHPALRCVAYHAVLRRLADHGVEATPDPLLFAGQPHCYVADPFGNRIELIAEEP